MHQRKSKKVLIYFFLLFLVGSINNIELNNINFDKIKNIEIKGLEERNNLVLLKELKKLNLGNIFIINKTEISNQIKSNNLVEEFKVFKRYPSSLDIDIKKTKFLAKVNYRGKIMLIGSNGKLSSNDFSTNQLPFIFGKLDMFEFLKIKKTIDESRFSYDEIKNLFFFSSKRWDIELKNNVMIKLSKYHTKESLEIAFEFLHDSNFRDIKIIDARIKNQIITND
jgi:cell division protein FtsQ